MLWESGADLSIKNRSNETPFIQSVKRHRVNAANTLLSLLIRNLLKKKTFQSNFPRASLGFSLPLPTTKTLKLDTEINNSNVININNFLSHEEQEEAIKDE